MANHSHTLNTTQTKVNLKVTRVSAGQTKPTARSFISVCKPASQQMPVSKGQCSIARCVIVQSIGQCLIYDTSRLASGKKKKKCLDCDTETNIMATGMMKMMHTSADCGMITGQSVRHCTAAWQSKQMATVSDCTASVDVLALFDCV